RPRARGAPRRGRGPLVAGRAAARAVPRERPAAAGPAEGRCRPRALSLPDADRGVPASPERGAPVTWPRAPTARRAILVRAVSSGLGVALSVAGGRALAQTPAPDIIIPVTPPARVRSQRAVQPLPAGLQFRLQRAVDLRVSGLPDRARDTLQVLLKEAPHPPQLVSELARAQRARQDWAAVERLGTAERAAARDSSLLGEELATALERLGKPRDALKVAV